MDHAAILCLVRFQAFPFIPEDLKRRPLRYLFEMDVQHPIFQRIAPPLVTNNQFTAFCRFLGKARHARHAGLRHPSDGRDYELIETLFWEEADAALAARLVRALLRFPHRSSPLLWNSAINLLLRATTAADKEAALVLLEAFSEI